LPQPKASCRAVIAVRIDPLWMHDAFIVSPRKMLFHVVFPVPSYFANT
jgi:hypothetical protein